MAAPWAAFLRRFAAISRWPHSTSCPTPRARSPGLRGHFGWLALIQYPHGFENYASYDFQAFGTQFVHRILCRVMEHVVIAVVEVYEVGTGRRRASRKERDRRPSPWFVQRNATDSPAAGRLDRLQSSKPRGRIRIMFDV